MSDILAHLTCKSDITYITTTNNLQIWIAENIFYNVEI